ncbi:hypothetical protein EPI10_018854 [Gossypium australe]|uniref:Uncharacterized protein n=1 Tax=Gossypium australe TaxID=47621 RepID=A0A5B6UCX3_9ROSI|nr:hypothetical protein EPI10_018854 [Gossypium australe]
MEKVNGDWLLSTPIKNATVEQVENKLNNYRKRLINSGDVPLNTTSHFNPTFESPVELAISLNPNLLDPSKHKTMVFKDNHGDNTTISLEGCDLGISDIDSITKMCASLGKGTAIRKGRARNKIIKDHGECFKTKVSDGKADLIIAYLGFQYSHRVKAVGFSDARISKRGSSYERV